MTVGKNISECTTVMNIFKHFERETSQIQSADDIIVLSATVSGLQEMLNICNNTILDMDLSFNCKKSVYIRFGPVCKLPLQTCILVAQQLLGVTVLDILV